MLKLRHLKARLSQAEYDRLRERADAAGLNLSEYARSMLAHAAEQVDVESVLAELRAQLQAATAASAAAAATTQAALQQTGPDPLLVEILWLLRELAAERNAQVLARIASRLDAVFGRDRSRV